MSRFEAEAIAAAPWNGVTKTGTAEYDAKVAEIRKRADFLAMIKHYSAENYQWTTVILTP